MTKKKNLPQQEFPFDGNGWAHAPDRPEEGTPVKTDEDHDPMQNGPGPLRGLMDFNFLAYASYVICDRAIPDMADGLKPVQRRILHSLHERDDGRFIKVASVVGHCMQYHPHGDASIGAALVNLANRDYLIERQGNFGNIFTGDPPAAARYIECRLTELARNEVFNDALSEFVPSYDGRNKEPVTLACKLPLLLMQGAEGIAVGMSTRILPHNFPELIEAQIALLQKKPFSVLPDFLQGGKMDVSEYEDGIGRIRLRALIEAGSKDNLVIRELPYGQTTETLVASIEDAVRKKKVPVRTINDFTAEKVEIEVVLTPGTKPSAAIESLFAFTTCETSVSSRPVVIQDRRPRDITVSEILRENTRLLVDLLKRELELRRDNLLDDFHAKTLAQIFIENRVYKVIETCKTAEAVQTAVLEGVAPYRHLLRRDVTPKDVEMLLAIRIRRISLFDIEKNRRDIETILKELAQIEKDLKRLTPYTVSYLKRLLKTYGSRYPRLTKVESFKTIEVRRLTASELQICHDTEHGYLGHAVKGEPVLECSSLDKLIIAWANGEYRLTAPPDKLFVDKNMLYCDKHSRERVMTAIYVSDGFTYMKRFTFGGAIQNKEYRLAPEGATVLFLEEGTPETVYVKYKPSKGQRIHQQLFHPSDMPVKGVKARGNQMTAKRIDRIATSQPRWWNADEDAPKGRLI